MLWLSVAPLISGLVAEMFDTRYMATLLGIAFVMHQAGSSLGALGGSLIFDPTGSYDGAWKIGVLIGFTAGVVQIVAGGPRGCACLALGGLALARGALLVDGAGVVERAGGLAEHPAADEPAVPELGDTRQRPFEHRAPFGPRRRHAADADDDRRALLVDVVVGDRERAPIAARDLQALADAVVAAARAAVGERELAIGVDEGGAPGRGAPRRTPATARRTPPCWTGASSVYFTFRCKYLCKICASGITAAQELRPRPSMPRSRRLA